MSTATSALSTVLRVVNRATFTFFDTRIEIVTNFRRSLLVIYKTIHLKLSLNIACTQRAFFASNYSYLKQQSTKICSYREVHYTLKGKNRTNISNFSVASAHTFTVSPSANLISANFCRQCARRFSDRKQFELASIHTRRKPYSSMAILLYYVPK
jgi:hypothetical protein